MSFFDFNSFQMTVETVIRRPANVEFDHTVWHERRRALERPIKFLCLPGWAIRIDVHSRLTRSETAAMRDPYGGDA
jgi:hypothetical protein